MLGLANIANPLAYTSNCFKLLLTDVLLFIHLSITWPLTAGLPSIVLPFRPCGSGPLDELYLSWDNFKADIAHTFLFIAQVLFLGSLVCFLFMGLPAALYLGYIAAFIVGNMYFCQWFLNGPPNQKFFAGEEFVKNAEDDGTEWVSKDSAHEGEKWVFINGVAVGSHWMHSNLERLAKTFRRPILGIHNPSFGIPFDVLECILQRTFAYPTLDIRNAYTAISTLLSDPSITKLVLIAHSQGAIEAGMVLDWLYATMPVKDVEKLEVFTFGNASNHWNCPVREDGGPVVEHVEHYTNGGDWVARFGILHFRQAVDNSSEAEQSNPALGDGAQARETPLPQTPILPDEGVRKKSTFELEKKRAKKNRFVGRMFKRVGFPGHQMNQHYLDNMFVMDEKLTKVLDDEDVGVQSEHSSNGKTKGVESFMHMEIDHEMLETDDAVVPVPARKKDDRTVKNGVQTRSEGRKQAVNAPMKVKELSRLWLYRNGRTPEDWIFHDRERQ